MKNVFKSSILSLVLLSCGSGEDREGVTDTIIPQKDSMVPIVSDTTPKVTGVGGIFFFSDDPKEAKAWYEKNLGLVTNDYGSTFEFRNANRPDEVNYLQWSVFKKGNKYFSPSKKEFMINYRVQNMEALVKRFKENGVTILDTIEVYDYGKFLHIMDPEGNKIELWEPIDSVLSKIGSKTTK